MGCPPNQPQVDDLASEAYLAGETLDRVRRDYTENDRMTNS